MWRHTQPRLISKAKGRECYPVLGLSAILANHPNRSRFGSYLKWEILAAGKVLTAGQWFRGKMKAADYSHTTRFLPPCLARYMRRSAVSTS